MSKLISTPEMTFERMFYLLCKYPIYIDIFTSIRSWADLLSLMNKNYQTSSPKTIPDNEADEIFGFIINLLLNAEKDIEETENNNKYDFPVFSFEFDAIKNFMQHNIKSTIEKILYLNYILKEYPNHIVLRMNKLTQIINELLSEENFIPRYITALNTLGRKLSNKDILFPVVPMRFEDKIITEIKYLNLRLGFEKSTDFNHLEQDNEIIKILEDVKAKVENLGNKEEDDLLTIAEALKYLKISRSTLYRWINGGLLTYTIIGTKKYLSREEVKKHESKITGKRKSK